jgi:hypothetical protein
MGLPKSVAIVVSLQQANGNSKSGTFVRETVIREKVGCSGAGHYFPVTGASFCE